MSVEELTSTIDDAAVSVFADGQELIRYVYRPDGPQRESPRPYLFPVRSLAGRDVADFRPHDHVWHRGISWSLPVVGDENFWGGPTYVRGRGYVQLANNGAQRHVRMIRHETTSRAVSFTHELEWIAEAGEKLFAERRTLEIGLLPDPGTWVLLFEVEMTNVTDREIRFGSPTTKGRDNAGYGGLFWRGVHSFTGGAVRTADSEGGDDLRGRTGEWMAFVGRHDEVDAQSTVLMLDSADNPHSPPRWFVRSEDYPALNPAPFFSEELAVAPRQTVRFVYGVAVADGVPDPSRLADLVRERVRAHHRRSTL